MKLSWLLILVLCFVPNLKAQSFYSLSDLEIGNYHWESEEYFDYLISHGQKISYSSSLYASYGTSSTAGVTPEIVYTFLKDGKFLCFSFAGYGPILHSNGKAQMLRYEDSSINYVMNQSYFNIDFENIVYDPIFDQVLIPCGYSDSDSNRGYNAICLKFNKGSYEMPVIPDELDENEAHYFDLRGRLVDPETSKESILIKTDGKKSVKFLNKKP